MQKPTVFGREQQPRDIRLAVFGRKNGVFKSKLAVFEVGTVSLIQNLLVSGREQQP